MGSRGGTEERIALPKRGHKPCNRPIYPSMSELLIGFNPDARFTRSASRMRQSQSTRRASWARCWFQPRLGKHSSCRQVIKPWISICSYVFGEEVQKYLYLRSQPRRTGEKRTKCNGLRAPEGQNGDQPVACVPTLCHVQRKNRNPQPAQC